ncbi:Chitin binding domain-containing protein [Aphelenchoides besseyi]|nr:Chitin binding domain-containing protein [Aphelenchoides besseyi]KAI6227930.1 Chitin binding domain-containing protein [Aphelenchoides besseyi]
MTRTVFVWSIFLATLAVGQKNAARPAPPEIACAGHADGLYLRDPRACNSGFHKCANGRSFYYECPPGLFFSSEDARCEYKSTIPACGGVRPAKQPIVQQPVAPVAPVHQLIAPAIPAQPIAPVYPISYVAPTQPVAPVAIQQQQYEQPTQQQPVPVAPVAPIQTTESPAPQPIYTAETPVPQAPINLVAQPSDYAVPSQQSYAQTTSAPQVIAPVAPVVQTPAPQPSYQSPVAPVAPVIPQYEQPTQPPAPVAPVQYQQPTQPPAPVAPVQYQQPTQPPAPVAPVQYQQQQSFPVAPQAAVQPKLPPVDFNCGSNADGYYFKQPCTSSYYSCVGGQALKLNCAGNTVYDPAIQQCDYAEVCGKPRPPTTTTQRPSTTPPSTACVGKTDGFYQKGRCQSKYLHCTNGIAFDLQCQDQLVFSGQQCVYANDCLYPTSPAPIAVQTTTVPAPPRSQWCQQNGKTTGVYVQGCATKFYVCGGGITTVIDCPANLVYDVTTGSCDVRQFVPACGGVRPVTTTTVAAPIAPVRPVNYNCQGKSDGYYGSGCSASYYSCVGGTATEISCPGGTRYSSQLHTCDYQQNIPECGGQLPTTTVAAPIAPAISSYTAPVAPVAPVVQTPAPQPSYQSPVAPVAPVIPQYEQPTQPPAPVAPVQYQQPTQPPAPVAPVQYQQPTQPPAPVAPIQTQPTTTYSPPTAPVYTPQPTTSQSPVYQPPSTTYTPPATNYVAPVIPAQPIAPVATPEDYDVNPCEKLPDGIYGRRCSRHYFVCSVNKTYEFTCPSGYAYDRQLARCGHKSGIANCTSATPIVSAPQAAVSSAGYSG